MILQLPTIGISTPCIVVLQVELQYTHPFRGTHDTQITMAIVIGTCTSYTVHACIRVLHILIHTHKRIYSFLPLTKYAHALTIVYSTRLYGKGRVWCMCTCTMHCTNGLGEQHLCNVEAYTAKMCCQVGGIVRT